MRDKDAEQPEPTRRVRSTVGRRLEEIFCRDLGTEDPTRRDEDRDRENWYRENRPPHHDGH